MVFLVGSVITAAIVLLLLFTAARPRRGELPTLRFPAYMLLLGVPSLVAPTSPLELAALASASMAMFELVLLLY